MIYHVNYITADGKHHVMDCLNYSFDEDSVVLTDLDGNQYEYWRWNYWGVDPMSLGISELYRYIDTLNIKEVCLDAV